MKRFFILLLMFLLTVIGMALYEGWNAIREFIKQLDFDLEHK